MWKRGNPKRSRYLNAKRCTGGLYMNHFPFLLCSLVSNHILKYLYPSSGSVIPSSQSPMRRPPNTTCWMPKYLQIKLQKIGMNYGWMCLTDTNFPNILGNNSPLLESSVSIYQSLGYHFKFDFPKVYITNKWNSQIQGLLWAQRSQAVEKHINRKEIRRAKIYPVMHALYEQALPNKSQKKGGITRSHTKLYPSCPGTRHRLCHEMMMASPWNPHLHRREDCCPWMSLPTAFIELLNIKHFHYYYQGVLFFKENIKILRSWKEGICVIRKCNTITTLLNTLYFTE